MKKIALPFIIIMLMTSSCEKILIPSTDNSPKTVFDYLWQVLDNQYAFFDIKGVDWDSIYNIYEPRITNNMNDDQLFDVLARMLAELHDGHTNLFATYNTSQDPYLVELQYSQMNIDSRLLVLNYLTPDIQMTGGFRHNALRDGKIAYLYYPSFSNSASYSYLNYLLNNRYKDAEGLILDIRQNGGGNISNEWNILRILPNNNQLLYETQIKNGPAHDDFTPWQQVYAPATYDSLVWSKPMALLTDRGSYSASSFFALCCKAYANVVQIGDTTLGGLGLPNGGELPNGWHYRFSLTRTLAPNGTNWENGVPPDIYVKLDANSIANGIDNVIERACEWILSQQ